LSSEDLESKWGFGDGDVLEDHATWWRDQLGLRPGHPYVSSRDALCDLVERHLVSRLPAEQRAGMQRVGTVHNPYRADISIAGHVDRIEVVVEEEIAETFQRLFPPRRPEELLYIEICESHWLPWRVVIDRIESVPADVLRLAAENLSAALADRWSPFPADGEEVVLLEAETAHALELARLACS
jgi:hypothetical protein